MDIEAEELQSIIGLIYEAAIKPELWESLLPILGKPINSNAGHLFSVSKTNDVVLDCYNSDAVEIDPQQWKLHEELVLNDLNPRIAYAATAVQPGVLVDYMHTSETDIRKNVFYQSLGKELEIDYYGGLVFPGEQQQFTSLGLFRSKDEGHLDRSDISYLKLLAPHVQRSVALMRRNRVRQLLLPENPLSSAAPTILLDGRGQVVELSESAEMLVKQSRSLSIENRRVVLGDAIAQRELEVQLKHLVVKLSIDQPLSRYIIVDVESRIFPLYLMVAPLTRIADKLSGIAGAIYIIDPNERPQHLIDTLMAIHGLTQTEAEVCEFLFGGGTLREFSERRGVSIESPRFHLKNIFSKLNVSKQSELIRVIAQVSKFFSPINEGENVS